jgi:hypothetical protein
MKLAILLCEGPHDVAFIYRLLRYEGYSDVSDIKIGELPDLFKEYFKNLLTNESFYENSNLTRKPVLPTLMVKNKGTEQEVWLALYAVGGNRQPTLVNDILQAYNDFMSDSMDEDSILSISVAFINDADTNGVDKELLNLKKNYASEKIIMFDDIPLEKNEVFKIITKHEGTGFTKQGYYIFCNQERKGKLEDIVLGLMEKDNKSIFDSVKKFLETSVEHHRKEKKYDIQKSTIGSAGQLLKSGRTNTVIINDGCYLTPEKTNDDSKCQEIIAFINEMTNI